MSFTFRKSDIFSKHDEWGIDGNLNEAVMAYQHGVGREFKPTPCPLCSTLTRRFYRKYVWILNNEPGGKEDAWRDSHLFVCTNCLWFRTSEFFMNSNGECINNHLHCSYQSSEVATDAFDELETQLSRKISDRKEMSPGRAEDLVAGVFADHLKATVHYTTNGVYTPDGGVDFVLLEAETGIEYAFQVKRRLTDKAERVQPVREFIGAVAMKGYERGCFVTFAPRFTKAAVKEVEDGLNPLAHKGMSLQLVDGRTLREIIGTLRESHVRCHPMLDGSLLNYEPDSPEWYEIPSTTVTIIVPEHKMIGGPYSLSTVFGMRDTSSSKCRGKRRSGEK